MASVMHINAGLVGMKSERIERKRIHLQHGQTEDETVSIRTMIFSDKAEKKTQESWFGGFLGKYQNSLRNKE